MFILIFCFFSLNVNAANKYPEGNCIYNFSGSLNDVNGVLSIMISQKKESSPSYYYYAGEVALTDANDSRWEKEGVGLLGFHMIRDENASFWNSTHFTTCPAYVHFNNVLGGHNIYFSDNQVEDGYLISTNVISGSKISRVTGSADNAFEDISIIKGKTITKYDNCKDLLGDDIVKGLQNIVLLGRILIPILLNVFGVIDFGGAIFAGDEEKMKKAQKKFITRLVIGVVIFLIPSVLKLVLAVAHNIWPVIDSSLCGVLG